MICPSDIKSCLNTGKPEDRLKVENGRVPFIQMNRYFTHLVTVVPRVLATPQIRHDKNWILDFGLGPPLQQDRESITCQGRLKPWGNRPKHETPLNSKERHTAPMNTAFMSRWAHRREPVWIWHEDHSKKSPLEHNSPTQKASEFLRTISLTFIRYLREPPPKKKKMEKTTSTWQKLGWRIDFKKP